MILNLYELSKGYVHEEMPFPLRHQLPKNNNKKEYFNKKPSNEPYTDCPGA